MTDNLDERLLSAHAADDNDALITLYAEAARCSEDSTRSAFFMTHAWIFALEAGDPRAEAFRQHLAKQGRAE